jgi:hypothetical protein
MDPSPSGVPTGIPGRDRIEERMSGRKSPRRSSSWFPDPMPALLRARRCAEEEARQTNTRLVEAKDGKPVWVRPKPRTRRKRSRG